MRIFKKQRLLTGSTKVNFSVTFIVVTIVAFLIAESLLRLLITFVPVDTDPVFGTLPKPSLDTDARGFYNTQIFPSANIVTLGDSMTTGANATLRESWPQVLAGLASTSVYNMAVGGYGPVQYFAQLDQALVLQPNIVVVGFFFGSDMKDAYNMAYQNDYWKDLRDPVFATANASVSATDCQLTKGSYKEQLGCFLAKGNRLLKMRSRSYLRLGDITRGFRDVLGSHQGKKSTGTTVAVRDPRIGTVLVPTKQYPSFDFTDPTVEEGWRITRMLFIRMDKQVIQHGARFIVLIIPQKEEVYAEYYKAKGEEVPESLLQYVATIAPAHGEIRAYCLHEHIECVDALPDFVSALLGGARLYDDNPEQSHPIAGGYAVLGETVASYLKK